jgi:cysteine desulfurase
MAKKIVYLDYAAATPMDNAVLKAMEPYFSDKFYNPAANYLAAKAVKDDIVETKKNIAAHLGARHNEIIHTSGGTESNNLAIRGVMDLFPGKKILVSAVEHESVLNPAAEYKRGLIPVDKQGIVKLESLEKLMNDDVVLISVMLVNNETGAIQPIRKVAETIKQVRRSRAKRKVKTPIYLHADACQAPCYLDVNVHRLDVDMMTLNGGKIYGPKQAGILFTRTGTELQPQMLGGGQQRNRRSGTENPASVAGFAKALEIAAQKRETESARVEKIRHNFIQELQKIYPRMLVNGPAKRHSAHILSVTFPEIDNERLLFQLEDKGILAASGSACSASSEESSHVLKAMGVSESGARSSLRFSFGRNTTETDMRYAADCLKALFA